MEKFAVVYVVVGVVVTVYVTYVLTTGFVYPVLRTVYHATH
jgi:hypothetical protein